MRSKTDSMKAIAAVLVSVFCVTSAPGADRATLQKATIGVSTPLTGVLAPYGSELAKGLELGIRAVNTSGGAGGRLLELVLKDDASNADRAAVNTKALVNEGVLALTGYHGSKAIEAALPIIEKSGVPMIGIASSAEVLREPVRRNVFNLRAGARDETEAMVLHLDTIGLTAIAGIAEDDALGDAALEGLQFQLTRLAIRPQALIRIPVQGSAREMAQAIKTACSGQPQAIVLGLNSSNALAAIRRARNIGCMPQFYVISDAGAELLSLAGSPKELAGVIVSQVLPNPRAASVPLVSEYLRAAGDGASYAGLEGYMYARVIGEAVKACGAQLNPGCLMAALERQPIDVGGYRVKFQPGDHRGSRFVEMTIVTADGRFRR